MYMQDSTKTGSQSSPQLFCPCATVTLGDVANWFTSAGSRGHDLSLAEY